MPFQLRQHDSQAPPLECRSARCGRCSGATQPLRVYLLQFAKPHQKKPGSFFVAGIDQGGGILGPAEVLGLEHESAPFPELLDFLRLVGKLLLVARHKHRNDVGGKFFRIELLNGNRHMNGEL